MLAGRSISEGQRLGIMQLQCRVNTAGEQMHPDIHLSASLLCGTLGTGHYILCAQSSHTEGRIGR